MDKNEINDTTLKRKWIPKRGSKAQKQETHHHPYIIFLIEIYSVVDHQIHKLVKPSECPNYNPISIQLDCKIELQFQHTI